MRRETSNRIRFLIEDVIPPIVRDSALFRRLALAAFGPAVNVAEDFRKRAPFLSEAEYDGFYENWTGPHEETDNSEACLERIASEIVGASVCDAGCGTGYLLRFLRDRMGDKVLRLTGTEIRATPGADISGLEIVEAKVEKLPFADGEFDTVICTHVIEHILSYRTAIAELRRITAKRLIIVVPMERESRFGFNLHVNFFPYPHSFLRAMMPVPERYVCEPIGRDIYYHEDIG
jgi:SAM-dependent methyltransferase